MSIYCAKQDCACSLVHPQKAEVRDGRRYINGRDVGAAQPVPQVSDAKRRGNARGGARGRGKR